MQHSLLFDCAHLPYRVGLAIGKIQLISKTALTFEESMRFWCRCNIEEDPNLKNQSLNVDAVCRASWLILVSVLFILVSPLCIGSKVDKEVDFANW